LTVAVIVYLFSIVLLVWAKSTEFVTDWVKVVGTVIGSFMIVAVAIRASRCFGTERDRQTLDGLLTTPLTNAEIMGGKWLGALLSVRQAWCLLGTVWLLGLLGGGLHILSLFLLVASWWVYGAFAASLGLTLSLHCRTTIRATVWTLVVLLFLSAAPVLIHSDFRHSLGYESDRAQHLLALAPPGGMVYLTFGWHDLSNPVGSTPEQVGIAALAVGGYLAAAYLLWYCARLEFRPLTGRR
jgi:ABC-type transport system involved in multi-copper enzyme maturation permease subunit